MKNKYIYLLLLLVVVIIGSLPRAIEIISRNYLFLFDHGMYFLAIKNMVIGHHLTLIGTEVGGIGGFFQGPGFYYLLTIPFILFRGDPYGAMLLTFGMGILTILLPILFYREFGRSTALSISFFIAFSAGMVYQSRFIWPPFFIPPLAIIFLYFIYLAYKGKWIGVPLAFFILGVMSHMEIATSATFFASSLITILLIRPKGIFRLKTIISSVVLLLLTQVPLFLFDLRHDLLNIRGIIKFVKYGSGNLPYSFQNHLDVLRESFFSVSQNWYLAIVLIVISFIALVLIFRDKKTDKDLKKFLIFLILNPIVLFIILLPLKSTLWPWWFLEVPIILCFILGIASAYLLRLPKFKWGIILTFIVIAGLFINKTYDWYKHDFNDYGGGAKIKGKIDAIDFVYKDASSKDFNLLIFTPPVYTYAYDYLLWWHGENKYGFVPGKEKKGVLYLIIEPDPEKPWSYKGWLDTVIKTGKIKKTITLPSGTIIQERLVY